MNIKPIIKMFFYLALGAALALMINKNISIISEKESLTETAVSKLTPTPDLSYYDSFFKTKQEWVNEPQYTELTGDNENEIVYVNVGENCGSCHTKYLHIFSGKKEIFTEAFDDGRFMPGFKGFLIIEPVRKDSESMCCPSSYKLRNFRWDGMTFYEVK